MLLDVSEDAQLVYSKTFRFFSLLKEWWWVAVHLYFLLF